MKRMIVIGFLLSAFVVLTSCSVFNPTENTTTETTSNTTQATTTTDSTTTMDGEPTTTKDPGDETSIAYIHANSNEGDDVSVRGYVYATFQSGFFVTDGSGFMGVYDDSIAIEKGEEISFSGEYDSYYTLYQVSNVSSYDILGSDYAVSVDKNDIGDVDNLLDIDSSDKLIHGKTYTVKGTLKRVTTEGDWSEYTNTYLFASDDLQTPIAQIYYDSNPAAMDVVNEYLDTTVIIDLIYYTDHGDTIYMLFDGSEENIRLALEPEAMARYYADQLSIDLFYEDSDVVELPDMTGESSVEWEITNNDRVATIDDHTLSFTTVRADEIVILKATITYPVEGADPIVITKTFEIQVSDELSGLDDLIAYYDDAQGLTGVQLLEQLRIILNETIDRVTYGDARYILDETDADPDVAGNIMLVYTGDSISGEWDYGGTWNREHVWPQSAMPDSASNGAANMASDLHSLKPADPGANSSRGNKFFGEGETGSYEPRDDVKGDIARIMLYMIVMYEELSLVDGVPNVSNYEMGLFSTLLEWHAEDPVDDFEINRNEVIFENQGNRNPFIDYPEFVELIWGPF